MNALYARLPAPSRSPVLDAPAQPARRERRERDFGTGYGISSGYAAPRRYASVSGLSRFRCA
jgi:hypothetical protein